MGALRSHPVDFLAPSAVPSNGVTVQRYDEDDEFDFDGPDWYDDVQDVAHSAVPSNGVTV